MTFAFALQKTSYWIGYRAFRLLVYPFLRNRFGVKADAPWVIGGHRGRLYEDNCAALHRYLIRHTEQPVLWLTSNPELIARFQSEGIPVLKRHSLRARIALMQAPVLIHSHGEKDLDEYFLSANRKFGFRVYLNHCLNVIKAGQCYSEAYDGLSATQKQAFQRSITRFDRFLVSSETESKFAKLSFPHLSDKIILGGGAHLDFFFDPANRVEVQKKVFYFPTFRDGGIETQYSVQDMLGKLVHDPDLTDWLKAEGMTFEIGRHINSKALEIPDGAKSIFREVGPDELIKSLMECELFISDYSGIQGDYLALQKPIIHFVYDLEDYLKVRKLYSKYEDFAFGPVVKSVSELVEVLRSKRYQSEEYVLRAQRRFEEYFPVAKPEYAATTYAVILRELAQFQKTGD